MNQLTSGRAVRAALPVPYAIWAICLGTAIIHALSAGHRELPALYILALLAPLTLTFVPLASPDWRRALAPHNMVILFFMLEMFGEPLNLAVFHAQSLIPNHIRASDRAINGVLTLLGCAFVCYIGGYCSHLRRRLQPQPRHTRNRRPARGELHLAGAFVAVGCMSLYLYFGGFSSYMYQLSHPEGQRDAAAALSSTWQGIAGLHLKQFLTFGIVGLWCYAIDRLPRRKRTRNASLLTLAALPLIALASASFNRASMVVPLVGVLLVFSNRVKRLPFLLLGAILGILLLLAASWGMYRSSERDLAEFYVSEQLDKVPATLQAELSELLTTATALGQLEEDGGKPCCRFTLIDSVLSPIPIAGKSFRDNSGVSVFNSLVYGAVGVADQVVPFYFELFQNLHLAGIAIGYFILGKVIRRLERAYVLSQHSSAAREFSIFMVSFWVALLSIYSLGVLAQVVITLLPPAFVVLWVTRQRGARQTRPGFSAQGLRLYANPVHGA